MADFIFSAFADEASRELSEQIRALKANNIAHIELRGLDESNITEFTGEQARKLKKTLDRSGIKVSAIGSRIGKISIREDFAKHFDTFKQCVENAGILGTGNIRIFSFYIDEGEDPAVYRDEVFSRLEKMADYAAESGVLCCHENEHGIYGDTDDRCLDILKTFEGKIKGVFDPANFVRDKIDVLPAYEKLEDYIEYMHMKDCRLSDGLIVPCGDGDGHIEELLRRFNKKDGVRFLTLEPHLKSFVGLDALGKTGDRAIINEGYGYPDNATAFGAAFGALYKTYLRAVK